jgi:hypothetical protein
MRVLKVSANTRKMGEGDIQKLVDLNIRLAQHELKRDKKARRFFESVLTEALIFRRVTGVVVGKSGFLDDLKQASPFVKLRAESINVRTVDGVDRRALVTLIIVGTKEDGTEGRSWNIRLFAQNDEGRNWQIEFWYNYTIAGI